MKKTYSIEVDCANCAARMEKAVGKLAGVTAASVSYLTQKMTVETAQDSPDVLLPEILRVCRRVDADFSIAGR